MRRLLLATAVLALVPAVPAQAGPAACVRASGFPVCAGTCQAGDQITVYAADTDARQGIARCGGAQADCYTFRFACSGAATAGSSGSLTCGGDARLVICFVSTAVN